MLNVKEKVEVVEEKLRRYFSHMLDICSTRMK